MYSTSSSPFAAYSGGGASGGPPSRAPSPDSPAATQRPPPHSLQPTLHSYPTSSSPSTAQQQRTLPPNHHRSSISAPAGSKPLPPQASYPPPSSSSSSSSSSASSSFGPSLSPIPPAASSLPADFSGDATRQLRARIEQLERENGELKRSVMEMSVAYNRALIEVKERWKAVVRAGGMGGDAALSQMDGVGVINISSTGVAAVSDGKERERDRRERVAGERKERERYRAASPALFGDRSKLAVNGISVSVSDELDEDEEMHIERVFSSSSSSSSHSHPHHSSQHHASSTHSSSTPPSRLFSRRLDLLGHSGAVYALAFSGDGRLVASAGMDKSIRVWDMHAILAHLPSSNASSSSSSPSPSVSASARYQLLSLSAHSLNISSLAFAPPASSFSSSSPSASPLSSSHLISASFDKTVAFHDLSTGTTTRSIDVGSFATSLAPSSLSGGQICYVGTTGKKLLTLDRRAGAIVASWDNDTMVSAVSILRDSTSDTAGGDADEQLLTGDHGGLIRTWSSRMQRHIHSQPNDPHNKPISHLHCLRTSITTLPPNRTRDEQLDDDEDDSDQRTLIATNSFDDVLRVYETGRDRAVGTGGGGGGMVASNGELAELRLMYELKGVKNQNWPIKSSFYRGKEWQGRQQWMELNDLLSSSSSGSSSSSSPPSSPSSPHSHSSASSDDDPIDRGLSPPAASSAGRVVDVTSQYRPRQRPPSSAAAAAAANATVPFSLPHSRLLASGSADGCVYVFDVTAGSSSRGRAGVVDGSSGGVESESRLLQRLEGHRDRVYTCVFHPMEPVLLSAGADATVKVWTAGKA